MEDRQVVLFDHSGENVVSRACEITEKSAAPFMSKEIFFMALYAIPDTPMYKYFISKGVTEDRIALVRREVYLEMSPDVMKYTLKLLPYKKADSHGDEEKEDKKVRDAVERIIQEQKEDIKKYLIIPKEQENDLLKSMMDKVSSNSEEYAKNHGIKLTMADVEIPKIFYKAKEIAMESYGKVYVGVTDLTAAFAELYPDYFNKVVNKALSSVNKVTEESKAGKVDTTIEFKLPAELESFLTIMNNKFSKSSKECYILGRDEETNDLIKVLMKRTKKNVVLVGPPGVGKTALVERFVWMIVTGNCPKRFKDKIVLSLDINAIIAGTQYRGTAEDRFKKLIGFLENHKECILFIDEIHLLLGAGACREGELDLANALKPMLAGHDSETMFIGATTVEEYTKYFSSDGALKRRFEKIYVREPRTSEVIKMIANQVKRLEREHGATISEEMIKEVVDKAACFNAETANPDRSLDLLDKVLASAELRGGKEVTMEDVLSNFKIFFKKFEKMRPELKKATAYHEAGHFIVGFFSDELVEREYLVVSIYPAEDYLGVTVFDYDIEATASGSYKYHIQRIGALLAGRIAEEMYSGIYTSGASSDLAKANKIASDVVTKYALGDESAKYRVYDISDSGQTMCSRDTINSIDVRINNVLKDAEAYARNLLALKKQYLDILVKALEEKGMLTKEEIDALFDNFDKTGSNC